MPTTSTTLRNIKTISDLEKSALMSVRKLFDYADMEFTVARELGERRLERIPARDAASDRSPADRAAWTPDLVPYLKRLGKQP